MAKKKTATMRDVSRLAGVSSSTVSRYVNGEQLKPSTEKRVREAIETLDYRQNINARSLKTGHSKIISVLAGELSDAFAVPIIREFEEIVSNEGYSVLISNFKEDTDLCAKRLLSLLQRDIEGLLFIPLMFTDEIKDIIEAYPKTGRSLIIIDQFLKDCHADFLMVDNANSSMRAVEYLIHQGHDDIGIINGYEGDYNSTERYGGYCEALTLYGKKISEARYYGHYTIDGGYDAGIDLLKSDKLPTAVYITNCQMTVGFLKAAVELGFSVPKNISVISYDKNEVYELFSPRIPYVEQPLQEIGRQAAELMLRRIAGDNSDFPVVRQLKTRLVINQ